MIKVEITNYTGGFPDEHYRLFLESWEEYFATGAQSRIPRETFDNLFLANPFGDACFAAARDRDKLVGSLAAIPFTVAGDADLIFTAYQISVLMVSPKYRRQGVFHQMLRLLTKYVSQDINASIFTFPNDRSRPGFSKNRYLTISTLPTRVYFPSPFWYLSSASPDGSCIIRPGKKKFHCRKISLESAIQLLSPYHPRFPHFVKDGAYLRWRYFSPGDSSHFNFHHISEPSGREELLLVSTRHRYGKRVFTVLLEVFNMRHPGEEPAFLPGLLMKLSRGPGIPLLYTNESNLKSSIFSPVWTIALPRFINPRPIDLLFPSTSKNRELEKYLLQLKFATADWLGFL